MSAFVASPDFSHAVSLNPAVLANVYDVYASSDFETFDRGIGELFLPSTSSQLLQSGTLTAWDASIAFPAGPVGGGVAYSSYQLAGWKTIVSSAGVAARIPFGFSAGVTGKYVTYSRSALLTEQAVFPVNMKGERFTFDLGIANRVQLSNTTFFRAILATGAVFSNVLSEMTLTPEGYYSAGAMGKLSVRLPQTYSFGIAYTFASNYRLADFELFKVVAAADYVHLLNAPTPVDDLPSYRDQYRIGLETMALGMLAVRLGYVFKAPAVEGVDSFNALQIAGMGNGVSYGYSLRFPVKLVLPDWPLASVELSYAKNPEWSSGMYHDLFGLVCEFVF